MIQCAYVISYNIYKLSFLSIPGKCLDYIYKCLVYKVQLLCFEMIQNRWDFLKSQIHIPERLKYRQQVIDNIQKKCFFLLTSTTHSKSIGTAACIYPRFWRTLFPEKEYIIDNTQDREMREKLKPFLGRFTFKKVRFRLRKLLNIQNSN